MMRFDENVAKLILEKIAFNGSVEFTNADRPDLQNDNFGIGIEVTQAVDPKEAEIDSLYSQYMDPDDPFFVNEMSDEEKRLKENENNGSSKKELKIQTFLYSEAQTLQKESNPKLMMFFMMR